MSQKLENLLNLALDADQGERERSEELDMIKKKMCGN